MQQARVIPSETNRDPELRWLTRDDADAVRAGLTEQQREAVARAAKRRGGAMKQIPESEWVWIGHAVHYVCSDRCRFQLATRVGDVVVSTVGDRRDGELIDGKKFETMVFRVTGVEDEACGCPSHDGYPLSTIRVDDPAEAREEHIGACRRWAERGGRAQFKLDKIDDDMPSRAEIRALKRLARAAHARTKGVGDLDQVRREFFDALDAFDFSGGA